MISLVLTGSVSTFEMMDDQVSEHYTETAHDVGQPDLDYFDVPTTTCDGCVPATTTTTVAPTTTTTAAPTTTTTKPPTTTSTTTTTAAPTTTTTKPPTTTTTAKPPTTTTTAAPKPSAHSSYTDQSSTSKGKATAQVSIRLEDSSGASLRNATVVATMTTSKGETKNFTYTVGNGSTSLSWSNLKNGDFPVVLTIQSVTLGSQSYTPTQTTFTMRL